jgi:hypothetical protein
MRTDDQFYLYFRKAQEFAIRAHHDVKARQELLGLIEQERKTAQENMPFDRFLQGEHAFFSRKYSNALKCYLKAQAVPYFKLFCYRASAFVSRAKGEIPKASNFAKQALNIYPYDYVTLSIYEELLTVEKHEEEASNIRQRLQTLEAQHTSTAQPEKIIEEKVIAIPIEKQAPQDIIEGKHLHIPASFLSSSSFLASSTESLAETESLTQRLYGSTLTDQEQPPFSKFNQATLGELKRISKASPPSPIEKNHSPRLALKTFVHHSEPKKSLEDSIQEFSRKHHEHITNYLDLHKKQHACHNNCLYLLHGRSTNGFEKQPLLLEKSRKTSGGYYIRWDNKGIVINPGINFLNHFHQQGLHVRDIDFIVVTNGNQESYADIKDIYELNYQLNKVAQSPHIIHYYLSPLANQWLSPILKPNFKQERNTVHRLETFQDSPDVEKIDLSEGIVLNYFPCSQVKSQPARQGKEERMSIAPTQLGIRLDLHAKSDSIEKKSIRLGYVSGTAWSPLIAHSLGHCDILITGFGTTNSNDFNKLRYNEDCLGYFGCYSLLEEVHPQLLVCSEFNGNEGDIRLDIVKMMRHEYQTAYPESQEAPIILPAESNLFIQLNNLNVSCSLTKEAVPAESIRVAKSTTQFGALQFLSPGCCS